MSENRAALIVASYRYEDPGLRQLVAPPQDAEALARVLKAANIGDFEVQVVLNKPSHTVSQAIEAFFADRRRDDLLLLYFSGHGIKDEDGQLYFATPDTRRKLLRSTAVASALVNDVMRRSRSRRQVLLLDCCYSGAFARGLLAKADVAMGTRERFEGQGRVVLTASDAMQYSFEGDAIEGRGVQSIFTRTLVRGLETGEADADGDGLISLDELYDYVHDRVVDEMPQQRPGKWAFDVQGEIVVARNPRAVARPAQLPLPLRQAIESSLPSVREAAVRELARLLHGHDANFAEAARAALTQLAEDDSRQVSASAADALSARAGPSVIPAAQPVMPIERDLPEHPLSEPAAPPAASGVGRGWSRARLAIVFLMITGFLGPWFQVSGCTVQGQSPPPPRTFTGPEVYLRLLFNPESSQPGLSLYSLVPLVLGAFLAVTLLRLASRRFQAHTSAIRLERLTAGLGLIGISVVPALFLFGQALWGYWLTFVGVLLAPINLLVELKQSLPKGRRFPLWAWFLGAPVALVLLGGLLLVVNLIFRSR